MYLGIAVIVITIGLGIIMWLRRFRRVKREAKRSRKELLTTARQTCRNLLAKAKQGDEEALRQLWEMQHMGYALDITRSEWGWIRGEFGILRSFHTDLPRLDSLLWAVNVATSLPEQIEALMKLAYFVYMMGSRQHEVKQRFYNARNFNYEEVQASLLAVVNQRCAQLHKTARDDEEAFKELQDLICSSRSYRYDSEFRELAQLLPQGANLPSDWVALVSHYYRKPSWSDYGSLRHPKDMPRGQVRVWAANAWRDTDAAMAKMVLAYCDLSEDVLAEVGDVLTSDLAKLIAMREREPNDQTQLQD